jgi:diadenosine hexaphosphate hydrolase (ATP-forming)
MDAHTHAGGIVVRDRGGQREFLIVRARRSSAWVFPKGHVEPGETLEETAVREVGEEAGGAADIVATAGLTEFWAGREPVSAIYFVMRYRGEEPVNEGRKRLWCSRDEARGRLSYDNLRELLDRADAVLG